MRARRGAVCAVGALVVRDVTPGVVAESADGGGGRIEEVVAVGGVAGGSVGGVVGHVISDHPGKEISFGQLSLNSRTGEDVVLKRMD